MDQVDVEAVNLRDIATASPLHIKPGLVFRCSEVYNDQIVQQLKVRTVVDLRGPSHPRHLRSGPKPPSSMRSVPPVEVVSSVSGSSSMSIIAVDAEAVQNAASAEQAVGPSGPAVSPAANHQFSLIPAFGLARHIVRFPWHVWREVATSWWVGQDPRFVIAKAIADDQILGFTGFYILMLESSKDRFAAILRLFTVPANLPVLVHCSHGKDRTGLVVMLLQQLCSVPPADIIADYIQSEQELRRYREALPLPRSLIGPPLDDQVIASAAKTMMAVLDFLNEKYGSVEQYLMTTGLTPRELQAIKSALMPAGVAKASPAP